jgi:acetyl-CoA synthetase
MLACARIGAVHSVVFAGFSAEALAQRIVDARWAACAGRPVWGGGWCSGRRCLPLIAAVLQAGATPYMPPALLPPRSSRVLITASGVLRGSKLLQLKRVADAALAAAAAAGHHVARCLVWEKSALPREVRRRRWLTGRLAAWLGRAGPGVAAGRWCMWAAAAAGSNEGPAERPERARRCSARRRPPHTRRRRRPQATPWVAGRDAWWREEIPPCPEYCPPEWMGAEEPLFLLYTSGSTGGRGRGRGSELVPGPGARCRLLLEWPCSQPAGPAVWQGSLPRPQACSQACSQHHQPIT